MILKPYPRASLFSLSLVTCLAISCTKSADDYTQRVVIKVNDHSMIASEFADEIALRLREFDALMVKDQSTVNKVKEEVAREFIERSITQDWARERGIFVRKEDLDQNIDKIRSNYPDDLAFRRALAEEGITYDLWREKLKISLLQRLVNQEITRSTEKPSAADVKSYYENHKDEFKMPEEVRLRQIVLDNELNAKLILEELKTGKSLEELARKFSIAPEAASGGDIGWIAKGTLDIFDSAFTMKVGNRSRILKSAYGFHIFEVTGRRPARTLSLEDVSERIKRQLENKREQAAYSSWLEAQVRKAKVFKDTVLIDKIHVQTRGE